MSDEQKNLEEIRLAYKSHADMQWVLRRMDALHCKVDGQDMLLRAYRLQTRPPEKAFKLLERAERELEAM